MNSDIRISTSALDHLKIRRLIGRHGSEAFIGLMRIWIYAANTESKNGELQGFTSADIALVAEINDDKFGDHLVELGLLDLEQSGYVIHNWRRHNPYCCESIVRTESARKAAQKRWNSPQKEKKGKS